MKVFHVYIITNKWNTTLYIGVTAHVFNRIYQHRFGTVEGFSKRYHLTKLVYYEECTDAYSAFAREKQLKNWHRLWKLNLIKQTNPRFRDLADGWFT